MVGLGLIKFSGEKSRFLIGQTSELRRDLLQLIWSRRDLNSKLLCYESRDPLVVILCMDNLQIGNGIKYYKNHRAQQTPIVLQGYATQDYLFLMFSTFHIIFISFVIFSFSLPPPADSITETRIDWSSRILTPSVSSTPGHPRY